MKHFSNDCQCLEYFHVKVGKIVFDQSIKSLRWSDRLWDCFKISLLSDEWCEFEEEEEVNRVKASLGFFFKFKLSFSDSVCEISSILRCKII